MQREEIKFLAGINLTLFIKYIPYMTILYIIIPCKALHCPQSQDNHCRKEIYTHLMLDVKHVSHFQAGGWRRQRGSNLCQMQVRLGIVIMMLIFEGIWVSALTLGLFAVSESQC